MTNAVKEATIFCHDRARFLAPYRTGRLRKSIKREIKGLTSRVYTELFYAKFVEYGTRFMRPIPFIRPAVEAARRYFRARVIAGFKK
ncbi:MAG: HK97-gp10 family putative phage morphogenesis protein [Spirochaetota bacterium]